MGFKRIAALSPPVVLFMALALSGCGMYGYGKLGGADLTETYYPGDPEFEERLAFLSGVWYSHYAGIGRLDGYRAGEWGDFDSWGRAKASVLFPAFNAASPRTCVTQDAPPAGGYLLLYDDTVYGQTGDGAGGGGFDYLPTRYLGVVRAVNVFNGDKDRGAIIIEYLEGCVPGWLGRYPEAAGGRRPFFGVYYRVLGRDIVQIANAVDLAALYAGKPYYTEKGTLDEAVRANGVENEAEYISWGVVIPQDRER
ncbi:MAG: hypothetical protein LBG84_04140 [Treponema sp.]|jgi:hypothetical protein|nr:hypothetical protein [Treponema sp.]